MNKQMLRAFCWIQTQATEKSRGAGLAEYALLLVLVAVAVFVALQTLGTTISGVFNNITQKLN